MIKLPEEGLYISTKGTTEVRLIVEGAYGENPNEFYIVEIIDESNRENMDAAGDELDKEQWESLVNQYGLVIQK